MIKINLTSVKEQFEIGGKVFEADFSDDKLKKYFEYGNEVAELDKKINAKFPKIDEEKDFGKLASAIAEVLPQRAESFRIFFDKTFGAGKGQEIYEICGESTPNLQKVFEAVWQVILSKLATADSEGQVAADKYIKNKNNNQNNKNNKR